MSLSESCDCFEFDYNLFPHHKIREVLSYLFAEVAHRKGTFLGNCYAGRCQFLHKRIPVDGFQKSMTERVGDGVGGPYDPLREQIEFRPETNAHSHSSYFFTGMTWMSTNKHGLRGLPRGAISIIRVHSWISV